VIVQTASIDARRVWARWGLRSGPRFRVRGFGLGVRDADASGLVTGSGVYGGRVRVASLLLRRRGGAL